MADERDKEAIRKVMRTKGAIGKRTRLALEAQERFRSMSGSAFTEEDYLGEVSRFDHGRDELAKARGGSNPHFFTIELIFESSINAVK